MITQAAPAKFKPYTRQTIFLARQWQWMRADLQEAVQVLSHVLPFRTNQFVLDHLIDWHNIPDDPIFRLTFPHRDMLPTEEYERLRELVLFKKDQAATDDLVSRILMRMQPRRDHPPLHGLQHTSPDTVEFFPSTGKTCHAHCTYCGRWPQFATLDAMQLQAGGSAALVAYLLAHPEVTDVLITGGDPLVMPASTLAECIEPLLAPQLGHVRNIRIGTKSVAYWPHRFVTDRDAGDLLRLFERVVASGKSLAIMGHYSHAVELRNPVAQQAVRRIVATGASLRMQGPLVRHVNDDPASWAELWDTGSRLGAIPYYMFVERDSGPGDYFSVPLARAHDIFHAACQLVPRLAGTVNGPSMSTSAGKVSIDGIATINGEKMFALQFLEAPNRDWLRRPFFARFDPDATWIDQLVPAFGQDAFFFQQRGAAAAATPHGKRIPIALAGRRGAREHAAQLALG